MLLALRFFLVFLVVGKIWVEKNAALLGEIGLVRFLIDRKKQFLFKLEQFLLARVLEKRKLGFIDGAAFVWIFHQAQKLFVARLTEFYFEHETAAGLHITLLKFLDGF